jgi:mRNA-degrading endonuclease RelE of RelBE toxin-antitoxin system
MQNPCWVSYKILNTPEFKKEIKRLSAKYPSMHSDFSLFLEELLENPFQGKALGNNCYKTRLSISSKQRGKSGGARVITFVQVMNEVIILISIYDKSERADITDKEIKERLKPYLT